MKSTNVMIIFGAVLFIGGAIGLYKVRQPEMERYNRHMCAVYGYMEDCKTPLKPGMEK